MLRNVCLILIVSLVLGLSSSALAANFGKISGQVIDKETGDPLIGANVIVEGTNRGAAVDVEGKFVILQIPPGEYTVRADFIGYQSMAVAGVTVRTDRIAFVDFDLSASVIEMDEVKVIAERAVVERDIAATQRSVSAEDMSRLPATTVDDVLSTQAGTVNSDGTLHFRGGRAGEVTYYLDGVPIANPLFSGINSNEVINQGAIAEMQVISGTYSAEYGNAMSGIINITTRDGSDKISGSISTKTSLAQGEHQGDLDWDAENEQFITETHDYNRRVIRATVEGPIIPQKTNFFLSYNRDQRDDYVAWGYNEEYNIFAKITDRHLDNLKFSLSASISDGIGKDYVHGWLKIPDQYWIEPRSDSKLFRATMTHTLSPKLYYTLSGYYNNFQDDSGDYDWTALSSYYRLDANQEFALEDFVGSYEDNEQTTIGLKFDTVYQMNSNNEFKAGLEFKQHEIKRFNIISPYRENPRLDDYSKEPRELAAYVQDKVDFASIILSAGLRFDYSDPNTDYWKSPYDAFYNRTENFVSAEAHSQVSPRLAISYPVTDKTVFHFGYGHYFQRPDYYYMYLTQSDENYDNNIVMNLDSGNGSFGDPDLKPEKTITYEFGLSHQLMTDYLVNISAYSKKIQNLLGSRTYFPGNTPGIYETYSVYINDDFAYNNGIELQLRKRGGEYLFGEINYTYSVAEGSSSAPSERVGSELENLQTLKFFPLGFDQRHTLSANVMLNFGEDKGPQMSRIFPLENMRFSMLFRYGSGLPYTKGRRGATADYEINGERMPETWTIDLKIDKTFRMGRVDLVPFLEIYNLTNRENVLYVDPFTGKPDDLLGEGETYEYAANPENWGAPRLVYLGLNVRF